MTMPSTTRRVAYTGNDVTTAFSVTFPFFGTGSSAELTVIERVISTGVETTKTNVTDYVVTGGSGSTGTVTANTAPASTVQWIIKGNTAKAQETDYTANDPFPAETHEAALDRLTAIALEGAEELARALKFPATDSSSLSPVLPSSVDRASKLLGFDSDGEPTMLAQSAVTDSIIPSAFMEGLLDDANAAAARTTLGLGDAAVGTVGADVMAADTMIYRGRLAPHRNLIVKYVSATTVDLDADAVVLFDTNGDAKKFSSLNETLAITSSGANGLDTGAEASGTWYFIWAIGKADGTLDGLLSASATSPTLPATYTYSGLLGAVRNNGSSNFVEFYQLGDWVGMLTTAVLNAGVETNFTAVDLSAAVPPNARTVVLNGTASTSSGTANVNAVVAPDGSSTTSVYTGAGIFKESTSTVGFVNSFPEMPMSTAQSIKYRVSGTNAQLSLNVVAFRY